MKKNKKSGFMTPNPVWFLCRCVILVFFLSVFASLLTEYGRERGWGEESRDLAGDTGFYDYYYYKQDYGSLRSLLYLHDDPDDAFYGKFWEAVRGYEHLKACEDYGKGAAAGLDYALPLEEKEREALKTMAGSPSFEENRERLEKMRDALP